MEMTLNTGLKDFVMYLFIAIYIAQKISRLSVQIVAYKNIFFRS